MRICISAPLTRNKIPLPKYPACDASFQKHQIKLRENLGPFNLFFYESGALTRSVPSADVTGYSVESAGEQRMAKKKKKKKAAEQKKIKNASHFSPSSHPPQPLSSLSMILRCLVCSPEVLLSLKNNAISPISN